MREILANPQILPLLTLMLFGCQSTPSNQRTEETSPAHALNHKQYTEQFEATEFSKCIDSDGRNTGALNLIWRVRKTLGQTISPFVVGFSGNLRSLQGTLIEFQSINTSEDERFTVPPVNKPNRFPLGSYSAYSLLFPYDEQDAGWAFVKLNSQKVVPSDVTGAQLFIPKFVIGGEYSTRYYLRIEGGAFHEFSCQAINDKVRERLNTFMRKDGSAAFDASRGSRAKLFLPLTQNQKLYATKTAPQRIAASTEILSAMASQKSESIPDPSTTSNPTPPARDFRPVARPAEYDTQYKHVRMFECGKNGALDSIWRVKDERGNVLNDGQAFISGFAGEIKDSTTVNAFYFSSVQLDPAPAFYSGQMPTQGSYYFPTIEFREEQIKKNVSLHSRLPGLKPGQFVAAGTVYVPRTSAVNTISVSLSVGKSLRGTPYQATVECVATSPKVRQWMKYCLATETLPLPNPNCSL